jgi:glutamate synthase domain-containing protein 2
VLHAPPRRLPDRQVNGHVLPVGGLYQWRDDGEPTSSTRSRSTACRRPCAPAATPPSRSYSKLINEQSKNLCTLRGLLDFKPPTADPDRGGRAGRGHHEALQDRRDVLRLHLKEAHETLAIAMNRIGGKSNTGEGGEDPARYSRCPTATRRTPRSSRSPPAASASRANTSSTPASSRSRWRRAPSPARAASCPAPRSIRGSPRPATPPPGVGLISPPPHHDIYSIEDLAELIHDLKNGNRHARISVKLVAEVGVGTIAAGVAKAHADVVLISGHDGGTGASPQTSIKHAGLPWELGLAETHQTLVLNNLRSRIAVETDGQLKTGRDVVIAALLGAEEFGFATAPLVATGCIMMRVCHLNTCPAGVATQDPKLREKFTGKPEHVVNFMRFIAEEVREIMAAARLPHRRGDDRPRRPPRAAQGHRALEGQGPRFLQHPLPARRRARGRPLLPDQAGPRPRQVARRHDAARPLRARHRARRKGGRRAADPQRHRVVGTITGSEVTKKHGAKGLPEDTIRIHFKGSAGQSFGAFMPKGMTFSIEGDANDYVGKGLSGGKIIIYPPPAATFKAEENIIIGNVALYGATAGEVYIRGMAGERFCVRNSGVNAVVEAIGDTAANT